MSKCLKIFISTLIFTCKTNRFYEDIQNLHEFCLDWSILCQLDSDYHREKLKKK